MKHLPRVYRKNQVDRVYQDLYDIIIHATVPPYTLLLDSQYKTKGETNKDAALGSRSDSTPVVDAKEGLLRGGGGHRGTGGTGARALECFERPRAALG